ncbi:hypothetical protein [Campylobacter hyointestinalis]|uniref:Uncharacterized protein n=3 Tax=Campylobacter hyointestinalis TaxID=198 RepID=A0A855N2R2_CAMHY|nr:hypothetical protein [Campylobacter hyointestinalis]ANE32918.1 hypothetical protein CHH_1288 [Campylobacter hyointestinalis subsp. hyointestinalis LMG 9260]ANE34660.1 hypothetical protein CHL_1331 [Campylobacter hyointestinalis subsp. lawsonii CCUG 27631]KAB0613296.1 hypothetical protein F7P66_04785 [Campylobacter hyointestinalis subsp. lawsonii]PPB58580.1 hypothetical protein CDQ70_04485 [Campylobacter hyointestinalis subsp. hyointestinalis]PPB63233.1 hypothetical protein CDQ74_05395 [Camp
MKQNNKVYCNICLDSDDNAVFIQAIHKGENVDICTSCMPTVIHGSGSAIKSNAEVKNEVE